MLMINYYDAGCYPNTWVVMDNVSFTVFELLNFFFNRYPSISCNEILHDSKNIVLQIAPNNRF